MKVLQPLDGVTGQKVKYTLISLQVIYHKQPTTQLGQSIYLTNAWFTRQIDYSDFWLNFLLSNNFKDILIIMMALKITLWDIPNVLCDKSDLVFFEGCRDCFDIKPTYQFNVGLY